MAALAILHFIKYLSHIEHYPESRHKLVHHLICRYGKLIDPDLQMHDRFLYPR